MIAIATRHMFRLLVLLNLEKMRHALAAIKPGQRDLIIGLSYDEEEKYGPRGVGIATVTVVNEWIRMRYYMKYGGHDRLDEYWIELEDAVTVIAEQLGTRAALRLRGLENAG